MKFRVIYSDNPWRYANFGMAKHGAAKAHYDEMSVGELCALPVGALAHPQGAVLASWGTGPKEAEAIHVEVAEAWGFRLVTKLFSWVKCQRACGLCECPWENHAPAKRLGATPLACACGCQAFVPEPYFGTGSYTGGGTESLWLGRRGSWTASKCRDRKDVREIVIHPLPLPLADAGRPQHSAKPDVFADLIHSIWPNVPKVELFARNPHPHFYAWGNQVKGGGVSLPELG